jgi:glutaredoxin-related protein
MVIVVYKKTKNSKIHTMEVYPNEQSPDRINNANARKPMIPNNYIIEELGIGGEALIEMYKSKYGINNHKTIK